MPSAEMHTTSAAHTAIAVGEQPVRLCHGQDPRTPVTGYTPSLMPLSGQLDPARSVANDDDDLLLVDICKKPFSKVLKATSPKTKPSRRSCRKSESAPSTFFALQLALTKVEYVTVSASTDGRLHIIHDVLELGWACQLQTNISNTELKVTDRRRHASSASCHSPFPSLLSIMALSIRLALPYILTKIGMVTCVGAL